MLVSTFFASHIIEYFIAGFYWYTLRKKCAKVVTEVKVKIFHLGTSIYTPGTNIST